jgi:hypothetical protein
MLKMLRVIMLTVIKPIVIVLLAIMSSVIMPIVMVPDFSTNFYFEYFQFILASGFFIPLLIQSTNRQFQSPKISRVESANK